MTPTRTAAVLSGFLAFAAACASKPPPPPVIETQEAELGRPREPSGPSADAKAPPGAAVTQPGQTPTPQPIADLAGGPDVKLLEAGAAPRRVLSHAFKKGDKQKLRMKAKTKLKGANLPLPTVGLDAPMDCRIVEVNATGEARFEFNAGPFKTSTSGGGGGLGGMLGGAAIGAGAPEKVAGWGWITPRGLVREFHLEEGASQGDAPVERGDPFPKEAVGVGARWEVRSVFEEKGQSVQQTSMYELLKLEPKLVHTKVSRSQVPVGSADASGPGSASSSGELTYRLGEVYPTGHLSMSRALELDLTGLGGGPPIMMSSDVTISKR